MWPPCAESGEGAHQRHCEFICTQGPDLGDGVTLRTVNMLPQVQGLGEVYHEAIDLRTQVPGL